MRHTANQALLISILAGMLAGRLVLAQDSGAGDAKALLARADELAKARDYDGAADILNQVLKLMPDNDQVLFTVGEMERQAGRFSDGLKHALQAIKINPKPVVYYILVAANAHAIQDLETARTYIQKVLDKSDREISPLDRFRAQLLDDVTTPKTYTIHWELDPRRGLAANGTYAVALPRGDLPGQKVTYELQGARSQRLVKTEANQVLYVTPQGLKPFRLTTKITVEPYSHKKELARATKGPIPAAVQSYLGPCESINPRSPTLTKIVSELKAKDRVETVRNILKWMKKNVEYKTETNNIGVLDFKNVEEIVKRGHAECRGYSMLFTALCRAAGVPARPVWGVIRIPPTPNQPKGNFASHNWAEVYFPGSGWIPVDPQKPETLGWLPSNIIRIFMDVRRSATTLEAVPSRNLVSMNGEKINFEVGP
jgi:transglutaminase-like putative cysteine protease